MSWSRALAKPDARELFQRSDEGAHVARMRADAVRARLDSAADALASGDIDATMAGCPPEAAGHYAIAVASAAYRRGFHTAAAALAQAAEQLPQDQLFDHLVSIGREQRTATEHLHRIQTVLS